MTGDGGSEMSRTCPLCGDGMAEGVTSIPFLSEERVAVVRNVPAEICGDCGEAYMLGAVVDRVEALLDKLDEAHAELSVIHYEAA